MSIPTMASFTVPCLCVIALATTAAHASLEADEQMLTVGPSTVTLTCAGGLTDAQSRSCEDAAVRWQLCQRVYVSKPDADDAFYACFEGAK
jgi:hypothetical protein